MQFKPSKQVVFNTVMILVIVASLSKILLWTLDYLQTQYRPLIAQYLAATLSAEEKAELRAQLARNTPGIWDTVPEPLVGRIAKPYSRVVLSQADITINNAGFRDSSFYGNKSPDVYRIVCLGDSFVFGEGGKEDDRWCDQLENWLNENVSLNDGRRFETLAIGLPSWTMLQEANYLTSRLSDYAPDLIIVLTVMNDIADDSGVTGSGFLTSQFSTSHRSMGSATMQNVAGADFGLVRYSALMFDAAPTSDQYWSSAMSAMRRLADLQKKRKASMLFSVLRESSYFEYVYYDQFKKAGINFPAVSITYPKDSETMLAHDSHPNQYGHQLIAYQYLYAIAETNLLPISFEKIPSIQKSLIPSADHKPHPDLLTQERTKYSHIFPIEIDFSNLASEHSEFFLGGIFPQNQNTIKQPWATINAGFLMKTPEKFSGKFTLKINVPGRDELFPLTIAIRLNQKSPKEFTISTPGEHVLSLSVDSKQFSSGEIVEVLIGANRYFTQIDDHRMKSYQLLHARLH